MIMTNNVKSLKKQLMAAIAMVVVAAIALSSATYAWFVNNATVKATGAAVKASTAYSLLISNDRSNFGTETVFDTTLTTLVPVSTDGALASAARDEITKDAKDKVELYDLLFATSSEWKNNYVTSFVEVGKNTVYETSQEDEDTNCRYFYTDTVYLKAAQDGNIYLDSTTIGINWPDWDAENGVQLNTTTFYIFDVFVSEGDDAPVKADVDAFGTDGKATSGKETEYKNAIAYNEALEQAQSLLKTLRVGFVVTSGTEGSTGTDPETPVGTYIYQLVASNFVDGTSNTTADNSKLKADKVEYADGPEGVKAAVAITETKDDDNVTGTAIIAGTDNLKTKDLIKNADTTNGIPVISGIEGSASSLANATSDDVAIVENATKNTIYNVDVYIWMEGCDVDTVAATLSQFVDGKIDSFQFGFCLGEVK
jgi:hypothetical protein